MKDANLEDPDGKNIEEEQLPVTTYHVIDPPPVILDDSLLGASRNIDSDVNTAVKGEKPASKPLTPEAPSHESLTERMRMSTKNPTRIYAAFGAGFGILLGLIVASFYLHPGVPEGRYDLGPVTSSATGLKGRLYINWEKTLHYRVTFETSDPDQQAGFAFAIANPSHPISIEIQLQNAQGFVLCSREIFLKYDARSAAIAANPPNKTPAAGDLAQLEVQERKREQGKDIFENQISPKGQIVALSAQGDIPCSAKAYESTSQWSFTSNFPSLADQDEILKRQQEIRARAAQRDAANRAAAKAAERLLPFSTEGDDAIIEFDVSRGVIVTSGRKTYFLDKTSMGNASPVWQDYPVSIHFRCDQSTNCTLMHAGAGALRAKLKR